jgi:hypothetical protein
VSELITVSNRDGSIQAVFSQDRAYRYELTIEIDPGPGLFSMSKDVAFMMLNPSTAGSPHQKLAGELTLDPTVTRCRGFGKVWGFQRVLIYNLFAYVSPYPADLAKQGVNSVGSKNDAFLRKLRASGAPIVCGWGAFPEARTRALEVVKMLGGEFFCLGVTAQGFPRHPLYLPADTPMQPWRPRA